MTKQQIGVVGLAVMGKNLAWNIESRGYSVAVFNRSPQKTDEMVQESEGRNIFPTYSLEEFVASLEVPRRILMMVKAGEATDHTIESLIPLLDAGDILIDGGNTNYLDTIRRSKYLSEKGLNFIGTGVSGGEEGALHGPSIMPGGQKAAYELVKPILEAISAKASDGKPCVAYIGPDGAGHYVKMVHNGIEYADMQLIAESYDLMKNVLKMDHHDIADTFAEWNNGELDSYLIEITADVFRKLDEDGTPLVEKVMDKAGQKGTGKWTSINALELGIPLTIITESVFARFISAQKDERRIAAKEFVGQEYSFKGDKEEFLEQIRQALYMSKICSYAQGFSQMKVASETNNWDLKLGDLAMIWREGCIIRAQFLQKIKEAYDNNAELQNLLLDPYFKDVVSKYNGSLRKVTGTAIEAGFPVPSFAAAITYFDSYRAENLPANLIQAQRDYFGAHTYERKDKEGIFHTDWK
ncbi:NADP-dependent phosphogluconate dehydrogenase [Macrococcus equipercicus]|uniref:6-phosphogluconate dehydrogenase, decarboxylating n=1 Tax=Macrococcus equipercicus TaxID=69967 RepID=A0A9Q9BP84_9STAP|nr:NADP-dependent phosphogluconate dehydrogenase [Macrococcus equipercicus]KAA1040148.1 NADP-dependent phosphogluconate dehydrogenase [Macrococcus equipercicus]UTH12904.1 NADP-dependent phosphogluconate dehydrogenase [Macrococcus equipercicus]